MIVDSHCHVSLSWYEPVESLLYQMDANGVERAVLVQLNNQPNNEYILRCCQRYPDRFAPVVYVDPAGPRPEEELSRLAARGARGVRLRPAMRSPGHDPLALWRAAADLGLPVSCCGDTSSDFLGDFAGILAALPNLRVVIEHLGSASCPDGEGPPYALRQQVFSLSRFANVYLKVPGLGEFAERALPVAEPFPFSVPVPPLLDLAYEAFGPRRLMWGSDFPPVTAREGYANALNLARQYFARYCEAEVASVFGGTALEAFWGYSVPELVSTTLPVAQMVRGGPGH